MVTFPASWYHYGVWKSGRVYQAVQHDKDSEKTAAHYSKQWGTDLDFKGFVKSNPQAAMLMPARQLPWSELFDRIRTQAVTRLIKVYDAGCGFGDVMNALTAPPNPAALRHLGVDLHDALGTIDYPSNASLRQGDITQPHGDEFDFIICRAAIHHTPNPPATYRTLVRQLAQGGTLAITAYAKKAPMREAVDDALRSKVVPMDNNAAFAVANQMTKLGRDLQASNATITVTEDLPFLGMKAGAYELQSFIYQHFMKCWHNAAFSEKHCDLVNFDWYHPPYAFRYELDELLDWVHDNGLALVRTASTEAQHYIEATTAPSDPPGESSARETG